MYVLNNSLDYGQTEEVVLSPSEKYRTESFLPVVHWFVAFLDQRLEAYRQISNQFNFFSKIKKCSLDELGVAAENLTTSYPDDLDIKFVDESLKIKDTLSDKVTLIWSSAGLCAGTSAFHPTPLRAISPVLA